MDPFHDVFRWNERFAVRWLDDDRLLLLAEDDALLLATPELAALAHAFERDQPLATLGRQPLWRERLPALLHILHGLIERGLAVPTRPTHQVEGQPSLATPLLDAAPMVFSIDAALDVRLLSCAVDPSTVRTWARTLGRGPTAVPLTLVFCDDLLDPRLAVIDHEQRQHRREWLPVKATGKSGSIGPMFRPGDGACWHCLAHRLARGRPWGAMQSPNRTAGHPIRCDAAWVTQQLDTLQGLVERLFAQPGQAILAASPGQVDWHHVVQRPQCPACGSAGLMAMRQWDRPSWRAASDLRAVAQLATGGIEASLLPHVSPWSGVVTHLAPVATTVLAQTDAVTVYRSGYFRSRQTGESSAEGVLAQTCLGKGFTDAQARTSALCEAMERYAACHQGDEAVVEGSAAQLDAPAWLPPLLAPRAARPCTADDRLRWAPAWSLTRDARCYLPLGYCYAHTPAEDTAHIGWTSNGCAAGATWHAAAMHGFLEVVERDAVAVWWYGRVPRPAADMQLASPAIRDIVNRALGPAWQTWALDLTHDLGIPVVAAVGWNRASGDWALGFGAAPMLAQACESALAELLQLVAVDHRVPVTACGSLDFLHPSDRAVRAPTQRPIEHIEHAVRAAADCGLETLVLDYSRPDLPLHTLKVVVPGMSHLWPAWTTSRVHEVPIALGWRDRHEVQSLNQQPLFL